MCNDAEQYNHNVSTIMKIDTCSDGTVISSRQFEQIQQGSRKLQLTTESLPSLRIYSNKMIQPVGRVTVDVYHQEKSYQLPSLVVRGPGLLGRDWLEHLKLDWSTVHRMDSEDYAKTFSELFSDGLGTLKGVEARARVRDANAIGVPVPFAIWCQSAAPMPYGDASQLSTNGNFGL